MVVQRAANMNTENDTSGTVVDRGSEGDHHKKKSKKSRKSSSRDKSPSSHSSRHGSHRNHNNKDGGSTSGSIGVGGSSGENASTTASQKDAVTKPGTSGGELQDVNKKLDSVMKMMEAIVPVVATLKQAYDQACDGEDVGSDDPDEPQIGQASEDESEADDADVTRDSHRHTHDVSESEGEEENSLDLGEPPNKRARTDDSVVLTAVKPDRSADLLASLEKTVKKKDQVGNDISPKLADCVSSVLASGLGEKELEALNDKVIRPGNCEALSVPKVDDKIWDSIGAEFRGIDSRAQRVVNSLTKSLIPLVNIQDKALKTVKSGGTLDPEQLFTDISSSVNMLAAAIHQVNVNRKEALKPAIQPQFKALCSASRPIGAKLLFGDDLTKDVKELDEASKVVKKITTNTDKKKTGFKNFNAGKGRGGRGGASIFNQRNKGQGWPFLGRYQSFHSSGDRRQQNHRFNHYKNNNNNNSNNYNNNSSQKGGQKKT